MESSVQKDCEEVFTFYIQEYEKMVEKWQKVRNQFIFLCNYFSKKIIRFIITSYMSTMVIFTL